MTATIPAASELAASASPRALATALSATDRLHLARRRPCRRLEGLDVASPQQRRLLVVLGEECSMPP
jgi:hypothetical protein